MEPAHAEITNDKDVLEIALKIKFGGVYAAISRLLSSLSKEEQ